MKKFSQHTLLTEARDFNGKRIKINDLLTPDTIRLLDVSAEEDGHFDEVFNEELIFGAPKKLELFYDVYYLEDEDLIVVVDGGKAHMVIHAWESYKVEIWDELSMIICFTEHDNTLLLVTTDGKTKEIEYAY